MPYLKSFFIQKFIFIVILLFSTGSMASEFYVDPVNGSMLGDGSVEKPWSTMQEVWTGNKIKTQAWVTPYNTHSPAVIDKNPSAPVHPGDTIYLLSGYHGDLQIIGAVNSDTITVKAAPGATPKFKRISLRSAVKWAFEGLSVSPSYAQTFSQISAMFFTENHSWTGPCSDISIKNSEIFSVADVSGWTKNDWLTKASAGARVQGNNVTIENVTMRNAAGGVGLSNANNAQVRYCKITNIGMDGIQIVGSDYVKIEYNTIKNVYSVSAGNHYDLIQAWTLDGTMEGVEIRGNTLIMSDNANQPFLNSVQGIGLFDGWFNNFVIENNLIITNTYHGISLYGANNCKILNNTVASVFSNISPVEAPIRVYPHKSGSSGSGNIIRNNFANYISTENKGVSGGVTVNNNITGFINTDHFVNPLAFDFSLKPTSSAIDAGATSAALLIDIVKNKRDGEPDIGAYEYGVSNTLIPPEDFKAINLN